MLAECINDLSLIDDSTLAFRWAPVGLLVSRKRIIQTCNQAICDMFQSASEEMLDRSVEILYPSSDEFRFSGKRAWDSLSVSGRYSDDRIMRKKDGRMFWCHVSGRTLDRADPFATSIWMFEDISSTRPVEVALTFREREIAQLLLGGLTSKEIARSLGKSHRTIEAYRARLMWKYEASSLPELVARLLGQ